MAYLLYGVVKDPRGNGPPIIGIKNEEVSFVAGHGLCAVVSEMPVEQAAPPVSELLAYGRVVEDLHRLQAVVPMRYGCFLNGIQEIQRMLGERKAQYHALLEDLEGKVEMGIRLLIPQVDAPPRPLPANGRDYLVRRKEHYRMGGETSHAHKMLLDRFIRAFSGLHSKHLTETAAKNGAVVLSIYFLVHRGKVELFRKNFSALMEKEILKALISGPWPPYNFVAADLAPIESASPSTSYSGMSPED